MFVHLLSIVKLTPTNRANAHTVDPDKERSILGQGTFGTVYAMVNPHDHQVYAVKELTNLTLEDGSTDEASMSELLAEVRKLGVVESEFIVQYRTSAVYSGRFYVMMELIASATLSHRCFTRYCRFLKLCISLLRSTESTTATLWSRARQRERISRTCR